MSGESGFASKDDPADLALDEVEDDLNNNKADIPPPPATTWTSSSQLEWLASLAPPSSSSIAVDVCVGGRFAGVVWDGKLTALYDLWPLLVPSPSSTSRNSSISPKSLFQQPVEGYSIKSISLHPQLPLLFQLQQTNNGRLRLLVLDIRHDTITVLGTKELSNHGGLASIQCSKNSGLIILTTDQGTVLSLKLCDHWLAMQGLTAFVRPIISLPFIPPGVYFTPDGFSSSRCLLMSLAIRLDYGNAEKGFHS